MKINVSLKIFFIIVKLIGYERAKEKEREGERKRLMEN
jgi:hypothetical protein